MIEQTTLWIMDLMRTHGPITVFIGVIIESVIVPIPSPLIIMGAGALLIEPGLSFGSAFFPILFKIVVPGATASTIGAFFAFSIAYWGGKPVIDRFRHFLGFNWDDVLNMERHIAGRIPLMIFLLRALPIVPLSLISGAAGVLRIPIWQFTLWTLLGSIPRCFLLGYLGYYTRTTYQNLAGHLNKMESIASVLIVGAAFAVIFWLRARMKKKLS